MADLITPDSITQLSIQGRKPRRVGHKGAASLAPGNSLKAFEAALRSGVDMVEFDVLSEHSDGSGRLLLAHDYRALDGVERPLTLQEALSHLRSAEFSELEFDVDIKRPGYALRVVDALREAGLQERALITATYRRELDLVRSVAPEIKVGWSIPRAHRDYIANPLTLLPAFAALQGLRSWLPKQARATLASGRFDAIMVHWRLASQRLVNAVREGGGELYVWTVDDAPTIEKLTRLGVDGIITNDPRLFEPA